ncbi:MAG TPA: hypothetical protein VKR52_11695 [Terracidiphilus sp.]|nr:hypothetical protein [Terracidiphilus sp.]
MKLVLKIVAALVALLIALPPSLAEDLCSFAQSDLQTEMTCCDMESASSMSASTSSPVAQDCTQGCCSIAPQQAPGPVAPEKIRFESSALDAPQHIAGFTLHTLRVLVPSTVRVLASASDLQALLRTFRI